MKIWLAETPYSNKAFYTEEKAKAYAMAMLVEDFANDAEAHEVEDTLEEALAIMNVEHGYVISDYDIDNLYWGWHTIELEE